MGKVIDRVREREARLMRRDLQELNQMYLMACFPPMPTKKELAIALVIVALLAAGFTWWALK